MRMHTFGHKEVWTSVNLEVRKTSIVHFVCSETRDRMLALKAVLNWAEHSVREQLCLLEMFKLAVRFVIDVFDLGEQLCSRPMGRRSNV